MNFRSPKRDRTAVERRGRRIRLAVKDSAFPFDDAGGARVLDDLVRARWVNGPA